MGASTMSSAILAPGFSHCLKEFGESTSETAENSIGDLFKLGDCSNFMSNASMASIEDGS
jgi:hypothetical protein